MLYLSGLILSANTPAIAITVNDYESPISPLQRPSQLDANKVTLGDRLFHEPRLSGDDSISCAHCHNLESGGGTDNLPHSFGVNGGEGGVNTPTVYNAAYNLAQFWDGRAASLEEQIDGPTHNPVEMASNWKQIIEKLSSDRSYLQSFKKIYGQQEITAAHIKDAIATFERSLVTINSPFDRFISGDKEALNEDAKAGYQLFQSYGCISCHQGSNIGGNMFQKLGVFGDYFKDRGNITNADRGRFAVTGLAGDNQKFKVPSLRLVTLTAPYFHDGSVATLTEAIRIMAKYQLGRKMPDKDIKLIISFLESLVGELHQPEEQ